MASKTKREFAAASSRDVSGHEIFCMGDLGSAHVMAHKALDQGRYRDGHRHLAQWLEGRQGSGSKWVHVQWHMLVFELSLGFWDEAYARFNEHILPAASSTADALTDAPAALWRLSIAAEQPVDLPWSEVHAKALTELERQTHPYVILHSLLAMAGAHDVESLDRWLCGRTAQTVADQILLQMASGLRSMASGDYINAAVMFSIAVPSLPLLGGSRAQNELFEALHQRVRERAQAAPAASAR